jgi:hypothetical protein
MFFPRVCVESVHRQGEHGQGERASQYCKKQTSPDEHFIPPVGLGLYRIEAFCFQDRLIGRHGPCIWRYDRRARTDFAGTLLGYIFDWKA